ncbi:sorbosone dehydrogenase family protein [Panacibacter sp. DH6]|uniref:Sorbosone dehydrogenase family protein n=1 Tax=Panacibacter microcysteis TaxID=2793269 RepID=A0A931MEE8_9BACT|nr:sorbosone dehydrogenase family protein [Panacibacter microcysteis]MBG9378234.1 sorbosone dehydrogenase family protein [Panacibacter microcysteis]
MSKSFPVLFTSVVMLCACNSKKINSVTWEGSYKTSGYNPDTLPYPYATPSSTNFSKVTGWHSDQKPVAPAGFTVTKFAGDLDHPRWIYVGRNGDIFVAESNTVLKGIKKLGSKLSPRLSTQHYGTSANRITLFKDADNNGIAESRHIFLEGLNQPFGMLIINDAFYVGNTDALKMYQYKAGATAITTTGKTILELPAGKHNQHWARNIITNKQQDKLYIAVGSGSNVAEHGLENEVRRACILEVNTDGSGERIFAGGLRNPVGMAWAPGTNTLWTAVNERDGLGDELVPDYITSVKEDGYYGWPFNYHGNKVDPRWSGKENADTARTVIVPDMLVGAHTASLGLAFYSGNMFPEKYRNGVFVAQHGSWNRSALSGYKVIFVPFKDGQPSGDAQDFLTGFVDNINNSEVHGRPVCVAFLADGSMLVTDDVSNTIWRISYNKQ